MVTEVRIGIPLGDDLRRCYAQRSSVHAPRLTIKIKEASAEKQFVVFARKEAEKMREEINCSSALPAHRKRLDAIIDKIENLMADIEEKQPDKNRRALAKPGPVYQLKVALKGIEPPIWRRIQIPDCTLGKLHEILQVVMGRKDWPPHRFIIRGKNYRPLDPEDRLWGSEKFDEDLNSISQVTKIGKRSWFTYEFDFGESWQHKIVLERTLEPEPSVKYPRCIEGARACPPGGVGGIRGYVEFLESAADPKHENYEDSLRKVGGEFDPDKFSVDEVNEDLWKYC